MIQLLLAPPVALLIYVALVSVLAGLGRWLAGPSHASALKSSVYASGELAATGRAAPGYRPFLATALFFAMLHLGVLMLGSGGLSAIGGLYLVGLLLVLLALIVG
ncbi:MAG: hypothetical protein IPO81_24370 [Kouleothrix sp.]|nr:hypothetical protein [Kouleothrix sp.]